MAKIEGKINQFLLLINKQLQVANSYFKENIDLINLSWVEAKLRQYEGNIERIGIRAGCCEILIIFKEPVQLKFENDWLGFIEVQEYEGNDKFMIASLDSIVGLIKDYMLTHILENEKKNKTMIVDEENKIEEQYRIFISQSTWSNCSFLLSRINTKYYYHFIPGFDGESRSYKYDQYKTFRVGNYDISVTNQALSFVVRKVSKPKDHMLNELQEGILKVPDNQEIKPGYDYECQRIVVKKISNTLM